MFHYKMTFSLQKMKMTFTFFCSVYKTSTQKMQQEIQNTGKTHVKTHRKFIHTFMVH